MASPVSQGLDGSARKIQRTSFSPWTKASLSSRPPVASGANGPGHGATTRTELGPKGQTGAVEPQPSNIVSDIVLPSTESSHQPPAKMLSKLSKIVTAQEEWEQRQKEADNRPRADSTSSDESSSSDGSSDLPAVTHTHPPASQPPASAPSLNPYIPTISPMSTSTIQQKRAGDAAAAPETKRQRNLPPSSQPTTAIERASARLTAIDQARRQSQESAHQIPGVHTPSHSPVAAVFPVARKPLTPMELLERSREEVRRQSVSGSPSAAPSSPVIGEGQVKSIEYRADNTLYYSYKGPHGEEARKGAIIPTGYKLNLGGGLPWPCAVVGCQSQFAGMQNLAGHFRTVHSGTKLQDNCDGTLTVLGAYKNSVGPSPPIVVSRSGKPVQTPVAVPVQPPTTASVPSLRPSQPATPVAKAPAAKMETPVPLPPTAHLMNKNSEKTETAAYLTGLLAAQQKTPVREDIQAMLLLKKQRDLPLEWLNFHGGKVLDHSVYACAVAYITGFEVTGPNVCTATINPTSRLSDKCIALSASLSQTVRDTFSKVPTCVGCRYHAHLQRQTNKCTWNPRATPDQGSKPASERAEESDSEVVMAVAKARLTRNAAQRSEAKSVEDSIRGADATAQQLTMEDWEFAPGRMESASGEDTIAMARSYLNSTQPIQVDEDVFHHNLVIPTGKHQHWEPVPDKLRLFQVIVGKINVKMEDKKFSMGTAGALKIMPGMACTIENRLYVDAIISITTIDRQPFRSD